MRAFLSKVPPPTAILFDLDTVLGVSVVGAGAAVPVSVLPCLPPHPRECSLCFGVGASYPDVVLTAPLRDDPLLDVPGHDAGQLGPLRLAPGLGLGPGHSVILVTLGPLGPGIGFPGQGIDGRGGGGGRRGGRRGRRVRSHPAGLLCRPGEGEAEVAGEGDHLVLLVESLRHVLVGLVRLGRQ